eukprot:TRINITY_DN8447_c0_g1_i10.p1 TRINITY_DN8447_c0_g1~~TRINITY_DN8447_c0_g1_i10.p1  ORF type:complete len:828 (+),score=76.71 TRINITY_DN8447_c0_g1_i10:284-2485(+)
MAGAVQLEGTTSCLTMRVPSGYAVFEQCDATSLEQKFIRPNAKKGPIISFLEPGMCLQHTRLIRNFIEEANPGGERLHRSLAFSNHSQGRQLIDKLFSIDYHGCTQWTFTRRNPETNPWVQSGIRNALRLSVGCVSCILTAVLAVIAARSICAGFMRHSTGATTSPGSSPAKHRPSLPSFTRRMFQARAAKILFWRGYPRSDGDGRNRVRELVAKQRVQHALKASQAAMAPVLLLLAVEIHSCFVTYRNRHDILGTSFFLSVPFAAVFCLVCKLRSTKVTTGQLDIVHCCAAVMWALQYSMIISLGEAIEDNADVHQIGMVRLLFSLILGNASLTAFLQTTVSLFYIACTMYQYDLPLRKLWVSGDWTSHYIVILSVILVRVLESERLAVATATVNARESRLAERLVKSLLHSVCDCCVACNSNFDITEGSDRLCALFFRSNLPRNRNFLEFLSEEDVERFKDFVSCTVVPLADQEEQDKPTTPFSAHLSDCYGNHVPCHIFCSSIRDLNGDLAFVFGINECGETGLPPAALDKLFQQKKSPLDAKLVGKGLLDSESSSSSSSSSVHISGKHWLGYDNDLCIIEGSDFFGKGTGKTRQSRKVCLEHLFCREQEFLSFKRWHEQVLHDIEFGGASPTDTTRRSGPFLWHRKQRRTYAFYEVHLEVDFSHFDNDVFRLEVFSISEVSTPSHGTPSELSVHDFGTRRGKPQTLRATDSRASSGTAEAMPEPARYSL